METTSVLNLAHLSPAQAVQSIDGVLYTIFEAADLSTQKCCREVSSRWHFLVTRQLRKQVTIRLCFEFHVRGSLINNLEDGCIALGFGSNSSPFDPNEQLLVMRNKCNPYDPQPSTFTVPNLIRAIRKNPRGFPCTSIEITTKLLGSKDIKNFLQSVGHTIRRLKLVLYYFYEEYPSFERTRVTRDLRRLLIFQTPSLEHFHLIAQLPNELSSEILNSKLDSTKNFLDEEQSFGPSLVASAQHTDTKRKSCGRYWGRRFLTLKSFTYEGLLPRQIVHDIIEASPKLPLKQKKELESAEELLKRVAVGARQPLNPYYAQFLETIAGKYVGKIWSLRRIWFINFFTQSNSNPVCIQLYNEVMESHKETLVEIEFISSDVCDELRIPAMINLKVLRFTWDPDADIKLLVNSDLGKDDNDNCESTTCQLVSKFPKLQLLTFEKRFNFGSHFALILGLKPTGPCSSIETVEVAGDCPWAVIDTFCTDMSQLFTSAKLLLRILGNGKYLPAFEINKKPPHDPRK